ncbi:MAG: heat-inducible transcription repressor HrcA [Candidatus Marinimicrobia bacterium]|nr:heat-inducible transcription repressor HrcA [Candidatus Neomarinimicrobiota bacterium]
MLEPYEIQLNSRDVAILQATIEEYIDHIQPVGSQFLKKTHHFTCSSATIRNTLAKLESLGLLTHPFTSAGRIPTDAGYRYYVDEILPCYNSQNNIQDESTLEELKKFTTQIDHLLQAAASVLSETSKLFSIALLSDVRKSILTGLELVELASDRIMMVIEVDSGLIQSMVFNLHVDVNRAQLQNIADILLELLQGLTLEEIRSTFKSRIIDIDYADHEIIQILLKNPVGYFSIEDNSHVFTSSMAPLLLYPEMQSVEMIRDMMVGFQSDNIKSYFKQNPDNIIIGSENTDQRFQELSIIKQNFTLDTIHGQLAVVGPTRMPYRTVRNTLNKFAELLHHVI